MRQWLFAGSQLAFAATNLVPLHRRNDTMAVDHIRYDLLTQQALRGVVRTVLADAAKNGLPGEHHFYIAFDTQAPGVRMSARLREQYPKEMTVILQHQFWDLTVSNDGFEVGLSFGGVPERLEIPFEAVKGFFDPSVQFGLQFEIEGERDRAEPSTEAEAAPPADKPDKPARKTSVPATPPATVKPEPEPAPAQAVEPADQDRQPGGGEVVQLDRFRKK
jgi:hypothetical protein